MRKILSYFFVLLFLWRSFPAFSQPGVAFTGVVKEEKENFLQTITTVSNDPAIAAPLARYFESKVNAIYNSIITNDELSTVEKEKAIRSLVYFIQELGSSVMKKKMNMYDIPPATDAYNTVLTALLYHKPLAQAMERMGAQYSQLMAESFSQYKEYSLLEDIAVYKRVASSPEYILQFLENKPGFRFADSLLLDAAVADPWRIVFYLNSNRPGAQEKIRAADNIYLQQLVALSENKNATEILPFTIQLAEKKISADEIMVIRANPLAYFQSLVNTLQSSLGAGNTNLQQPLRNGIRKKAMSFYVNEINDLHNAGETVRFASIKDLRPQDIYYIITSCGEELYTSSYLGLYKRLMGSFKDQPADSLFGIVQYDNFRTFIRLAANYNVLGDLLQRLSPERSLAIVQEFTNDIENDEENALGKAMDIADCFTAVNSSGISEQIGAALENNLKRCASKRNYLGVRLYGILSDIFKLVQEKDGMEKLWATLGDYELLKQEALVNEKGEIIELVLFYGDEDGILSFNNFLRLYTDKKKWEITKNENWISIRSVSGQPITIYANRPLDISEELDLKAQDSLFAYMKANSLEPVILVHRGHSYHLDKTLRRLTPSVRLAILGSCGGYNRSISIASINSNVQVIGSKKTGSGSINDPIISAINETLINKKDIQWPALWNTLAKRFAKDEATLGMFNEYFPPGKNPGLFVLKLFDFYNR